MIEAENSPEAKPVADDKPASRSLRKGAKEVLRYAQKTFLYRRDEMDEAAAAAIEESLSALHEAAGDKNVGAEELESKAQNADDLLGQHAETFYRKKGWVENVEMLLVAAIVVLGIRSFFLQPFIIPTNSMYPTYYGMQPKVYAEGEEPGYGGRILDKLLLGASHYRLDAEADGAGLYLLPGSDGLYSKVTDTFPDGKFFILPAEAREYRFEIGGKVHPLRVPAEFDMDKFLLRLYEGEDPQGRVLWANENGRLKLTDKEFSKGKTVFAFDVLLGDALFVDRMSYNFVRPKVGDPAVFRTAGIDALNEELTHASVGRSGKIGEDKYYIKRLVGGPGDDLEMRVPENFIPFPPPDYPHDFRNGVPSLLYRNGKPIEGVEAFTKNRERVEALAKDFHAPNPENYPGYRANYDAVHGLLPNRVPLRVPAKGGEGNPTGQNFYFAMGDNSADSSDGRTWGFVPESKIVGRALFVYYPFTKRWGPAE